MPMVKVAAYSVALAIAFASAVVNVAWAAATPPTDKVDAKKDIFLKCSTTLNGVPVITKEKFDALGDNWADADFAKFDPKCLGRKNNPQGVAQSQKSKQAAARRVAHDMKDIADSRKNVPGTNNQGVPADVARTELGGRKPAVLPLQFRDAYSTYSLLSPPPPKERATGTQITYTHSYIGDGNDEFAGKGTVIGWNVLSLKSDSQNPLASFGVTRALWAPAVEFDQNRNRKDPTKHVDYLAFKTILELEKESPGSYFPLQYFRYSAYLKTDSRGDSQIVGGYAEWEPYRLEAAIGMAQPIFGPVQFRWSPILHFETEKVNDAGRLTTVKAGDVYTRAGPIASADFFFADGPLHQMLFNVQYRYLWNVGSNEHDLRNVKSDDRERDISYFQSTASYNIDEDGYAALSLTYRDGTTPGNNTRVRDLKAGLTVKY